MHSFLNLTTLLHYHHTIELTCTKRILTLCKFFLFSSCRPPKFSRLSKRGRPAPNIKQTHSHGCFNHSFRQKNMNTTNYLLRQSSGLSQKLLNLRSKLCLPRVLRPFLYKLQKECDFSNWITHENVFLYITFFNWSSLFDSNWKMTTTKNVSGAATKPRSLIKFSPSI